MLPVPCSVVAVISLQPSTSDPAAARECGTLRLGASSSPSLPAHPGHPQGISKHQPHICKPRAPQPGILGAPTRACEQSQPPGDDHRCGSAKARIRASHCLPYFCRVSLLLPSPWPVVGLVSIKRRQSPSRVVLRVTAC